MPGIVGGQYPMIFYCLHPKQNERLTIKSQVFREEEQKFSPISTAALDKQHSNAESSVARAMKGTANRPSEALAQRSIAFECFGLSRVRCAGAMEQREAQAQKGTAIKQPLGCRIGRNELMQR